MATPTYPSKRFYAVGAAAGTTWGTAAATGAGKGLLLTSDGDVALKQKYNHNAEIDQIIPKGGVLGPVEALECNLPFDLRYDPGFLGTLIAALFNTAGTPSGTAPTGYTHSFKTADSMTRFYTIAAERPGTIWELASMVPFKLNIKVSGGFLTATLSMRGSGFSAASATNTATQMDALTYVDLGNKIMLAEGAFWMNAASGGALSVSDVIEVSDFDYTFERPVDSVPVAGVQGIAQPKENSAPKVSLKLTLPRASAANLAYLATFQAGTAQKLSAVFTGGVIATTYHYAMSLLFPRLVLMDPPEAKLDSIIKTVLNFEGQEAAAAPTGMTGYTRHGMELVNLLGTADYLA